MATCSGCGGTGQTYQLVGLPQQGHMVLDTCPACGGTGQHTGIPGLAAERAASGRVVPVTTDEDEDDEEDG